MQHQSSTCTTIPGLRRIPLALLAVTLAFVATASKAENSLDKQTLDTIGAATFEVVIPKPDDKGIRYEKPLPYDLLPYAIRNDKYISIGTAFAIGTDTFISASHVFNPQLRKQTNDIFLRNRQGKIFKLDVVTKLSTHKDFIVFSSKGLEVAHPLEINPKPVMNDRVYAVGNANGQGIVIRDGLYTSNTPEELAGEWQWIRFSAAASPGNSGGPLLDRSGRVIGVVLRKSKNENLNYALPIKEVINAPENQAQLKMKIAYKLENMDMSKWGEIDHRLPLPMSFDKLSDKLTAKQEAFSQGLLEALLSENHDQIFPNGSGSEYLLHTSRSATFPRMIAKGRDGIWNTYRADKLSDAELGHNGSMTYGAMGDTFYTTIRKPDNVSRRRFNHDPKLLMNLILKGVPIRRRMGGEKIKITSLGEPRSDEIFVDHYQRRWQVRVWDMKYNDDQLIVFSLPTPEGNMTLIRSASTAMAYSHLADLKTLTDFVYLSYYGTLAQWDEYLDDDRLLPDAIKALAIDFKPGKSFRYRSRRLSFEYGPEVMKITPDSDLKLGLSYFRDDGKVVWDVSTITVGENRDTGRFFEIDRNIHPATSMSDDDKRYWGNLVEGRIPYHETAFFRDEYTYIGKVLSRKADPADASKLLYSLIYCDDGNQTQAVMKPQLDRFSKQVKLKESG
jgi:serine protease Do